MTAVAAGEGGGGGPGTYHCGGLLHAFGRGVGFRFGRRLGLCCLGGRCLLRGGFRGSSLCVGLLGSTSCLGACGFCCFGSLLRGVS